MSIYENASNIISKYLGNQGGKFLERQCRAHLKVEPVNLTVSHIAELAKWVGLSASLIMARDKADALKSEISALV